MGITGENSELYRGEERLHLHPSYTLSHCRKCHVASHSFLAPFRGKMKGLKNFRKKIGLGSGSHSATCGANNVQPLRFHPTHGENISLHKDRTVAKRRDSFCKGLTFSDRPVRIEEKIFVKLVEQSDNWSGVIRFGFTSHNPASLKGRLPKYACPDLTNQKGFWAKAVNEGRYGGKDTVLYFYVSKSGTVYYGLEGHPKEMFFSGVETSGPLWVMIDVYGNSTAIELVNHAQLNNNLTADQEAGFGLNNDRRRSSSLDVQMSALSLDCNSNNPRFPVLEKMGNGASFCTASKSVISSAQNMTRDYLCPTMKKIQQNLKLKPLPFHERCGLNIRLSNDRCVAARTETEFCKGYVFTPRTIEPNEFVVVKILQTETVYMGGLTFGVTAQNPSKMDVNSLPEDSDQLLDREHSFIVHKNVANTPAVGDMLIFSLKETGEIRMKKNEEREISVFHVDPNVKYFWFFDLYGSTIKICAYSGVPIKEPTIPSHRNPPPLNSQSKRQTPTLPSPTIEYNANPSIITSVQTPNASAMLTPSTVYNTAPPVLMINCCYSGNRSHGFEPISIIVQKQPDCSSQVITGTQHVSGQQMILPASRYYPDLNNGDCNGLTFSQGDSLDNTTVDNGRNREHQLQEWAKCNLRSPSTNSSSQNECVVCCERPIDCVLYKCGHMCLCYDCAKELWRGRGDGHCPYCRAVIRDVVRTYKS